MERPSTRVSEIVTNLDDTSGEAIGHAVESLRRAGALDVWTTPIYMKHDRPGVTLSAIVESDDAVRLSKMMIKLTGSFGVRRREWDRVVLERRFETLPTGYGPVRIKVGELDGRVVSVKPEYADAARAAEAKGVSVRLVLDAARVEAQRHFMPSDDGGSA